MNGEDWVGLSAEPLPIDAALRWAVRPDCGAQVLFSGTVRDHAEGRSGVSQLEYEAYVEQVEPRLARIADEARRRWPVIGRIVLLHRIGVLALEECSVVVVVSSPASGGGVRGRPVVHRHPQGHGPHLEAGDLGKEAWIGVSAPTTSPRWRRG